MSDFISTIRDVLISTIQSSIHKEGIIIVKEKSYEYFENDDLKIVRGDNYNYIFFKRDCFNHVAGFFQRWGKTQEDDPFYSPIGPEILDLEISVNGCPTIGNGGNCKFCYKNNTNATPINMTLDQFKTIFNKFNKSLTQIAFGITGIQTNPDFIEMMEYSRENGVIPNFTLSGADLTDEIAKRVSKVCGALAVSAYESDKNICYDTVHKFTSLGMKQVNIHIMVSKETLPFLYEVLNDRMNDPRLSGLNAIVFLGVKPKGRAKGKFTSLSKNEYSDLITYCLGKKINFGFDSCSAPKFEKVIKSMEGINSDITRKMLEVSESCESSLFSSYINVTGEYWHCSFSENEKSVNIVDVYSAKDMLEVWYSDPVVNFRNKLIETMKDNCRYCPTYPEINS